MDGANSRTAQGNVRMAGRVIGVRAVPAGDWRTRLQNNSRQRIVNEMMKTLKRNLPFAGQWGLQELKKIVVRFEEKIYIEATSQSDYLRKISLKMMTMEMKSQNLRPNLLQSNAASNSKDPAGQLIPQMQQMNILGSSLPTQQNNPTIEQLQGQQQQQQQQQTSQLQPSQLHKQQQHFE